MTKERLPKHDFPVHGALIAMVPLTAVIVGARAELLRNGQIMGPSSRKIPVRGRSTSTELLGSHLRIPALKTENLVKDIGRFSETRKWIY